MTPAISAEAVARYQRDGFLHVPGVLSASEVEEFLADSMMVLSREEKVHWGQDDATILEFVEDAQLKSEAMRRLALHPSIASIAVLLAGGPLRLFKLELLLKGPGRSKPTEAHFDEFALPFLGEPIGLTAWVALVDVPVERGCMSYVPGSHLLQPTGRVADAWDAYQRPEVMWLPRVAVPIRAGDCIFHHIRVVHAAGANLTDGPRISTTTVYMDAAATYRPTGNAHIDDIPGADSLRSGEALDGDRFPLAQVGPSIPSGRRELL
jgi:phytanoyl-CoA hydroxylase